MSSNPQGTPGLPQNNSSSQFSFSCPLPLNNSDVILLGHGGGGRLMHQLIEELMQSGLANEHSSKQLDSAIINFKEAALKDPPRLAFTTDSFVVSPLFFPGGDIGKLSVYGTANDLAMVGAKPTYLSLSFILEEGLEIGKLRMIVNSIVAAACEVGIQIVTGDTKVVERGRADGIYINTSGIGIISHDLEIDPKRIEVGDSILLSGDIARHGMSIMRVREGIDFSAEFVSDCASLWPAVQDLLNNGVNIKAMRDLTRGGLASGTVEFSKQRNIHLELREPEIPVQGDVLAACELLGLDPLYVANEGCFILVVPASEEKESLRILRNHRPQASVIGKVINEGRARVSLVSSIGTSRVIEMFSGEQLPRIC